MERNLAKSCRGITKSTQSNGEMDPEMRYSQPVAAVVNDEVATGGVFFKYLILHLYFWHKKLLSGDLQKAHGAAKVSRHESLCLQGARLQSRTAIQC